MDKLTSVSTPTTSFIPTSSSTPTSSLTPASISTPAPNRAVVIVYQQVFAGLLTNNFFMANSYVPGDPKFGNPCDSNPIGSANANNDLSLPSTLDLTVSGTTYTFTSQSTDPGGILVASGSTLASCGMLPSMSAVPCGAAANVLDTPRATCEWNDLTAAPPTTLVTVTPSTPSSHISTFVCNEGNYLSDEDCENNCVGGICTFLDIVIGSISGDPTWDCSSCLK